RPDFEEAEKLLVKALESGIKDRDIREARFNLAYVRTQLKKYREALLVVEELKKMDKIDTEILYLELYLCAQLDEHAKIVELYNNHRDALVDVRDSKNLFS